MKLCFIWSDILHTLILKNLRFIYSLNQSSLHLKSYITVFFSFRSFLSTKLRSKNLTSIFNFVSIIYEMKRSEIITNCLNKKVWEPTQTGRNFELYFKQFQKDFNTFTIRKFWYRDLSELEKCVQIQKVPSWYYVSSVNNS